MIYGTAQAGSNPVPGKNLTSIGVGDSFTLFDGTEAPSAGLASVAFSRAMSPGAADNGVTFYATGMPSDAVIEVEGSNTDVDGDYLVLYAMNPDTNGNAAYTDNGRPAFYRAVLSTYTTGAMPVVKAQR